MKNHIKNYIIIFLFELMFFIFDTRSDMGCFALPQQIEFPFWARFFVQLAEFLLLFFICIKMTSQKFEKKKLLKALLILPVKAALDIGTYYATTHGEAVKFLFNDFIWDIFHIVSLFLIFAAIAFIWKPQKHTNVRMLKISVATLSMGIVLFAAAGIILHSFIGDTLYRYNISEHLPDDGFVFNPSDEIRRQFQYYVSGASELYGIASVFIRSIIFISVYNMFVSFYPSGEQVGGKMKKRVIPLIVCFALNLFFFNDSMFMGIYCIKKINDKQPDYLCADSREYVMLRGLAFDLYVRYDCEFKSVYMGKERLAKVRADGLSYGDDDYNRVGSSAVICGDVGIAFKQKGEWEKVKFKNLYKAEENPLLTEALKEVCKDGDLEIICAALPYFEKYEPDYEITLPIGARQRNEVLSDEYYSELYEKIRMYNDNLIIN